MYPIFCLPKKFWHFVVAMLLVLPFALAKALINPSVDPIEIPSFKNLLLGILLAPFLETLIFQFTFGTLAKVLPEHRVNWLILVSAAVFAAVHMILPDRTLMSFPITFWQGIVLQVAFVRFNSTLWKAILMTFFIHATNNAFAYALGYLDQIFS